MKLHHMLIVLGGALLGGAVTYGTLAMLTFRFAHPALTETQLSLATWHWSRWVGLIAIVGAVLIRAGYDLSRRRPR